MPPRNPSQDWPSVKAPKALAALLRIGATDWGLRDARPSDRVVMEKFILGLAV